MGVSRGRSFLGPKRHQRLFFRGIILFIIDLIVNGLSFSSVLVGNSVMGMAGGLKTYVHCSTRLMFTLTCRFMGSFSILY